MSLGRAEGQKQHHLLPVLGFRHVFPSEITEHVWKRLQNRHAGFFDLPSESGFPGSRLQPHALGNWSVSVIKKPFLVAAVGAFGNVFHHSGK